MLDRVDVLTLFGSQFGVATSDQLAGLGIARSTIRRTRDRGAIVALLPGVFMLAGRRRTFGTDAMAAQLYYGDDAYLTGTTAGAFHGLREMPRGFVQVSTFGRSRLRAAPWVKHTCTPHVARDDVWHRDDGFRVASPLLTLAILSIKFNLHRFGRAAEDAWHRKLITPSSLAAYLEAHRGAGHPGSRVMHAWVNRTDGRTRPSHTGFEMDVIDALLAAGLPEPERQHPLMLLSGELIHFDIAWRDVMLAVEPGHSWFHGGDLKARKDAARDRACGELGWHVARYDEVARADLGSAAAEVARTYATRHRQLLPPA